MKPCIKRTFPLLAATLLVSLTSVSMANPNTPATKIYKQVLPNGQVVYGDKPVPGQKVDKVIQVQPTREFVNETPVWSTTPDLNLPPLPRMPGYSEQPEARVASYQLAMEVNSRRDKAASDLLKAEAAFKRASQEQESGKEPLPGERLRNVNGTFRLSEEYHARQSELERAMQVANDDLNKALDAYRVAK